MDTSTDTQYEESDMGMTLELGLVGSMATIFVSGIMGEIAEDGARMSTLGVAGLSCVVALACVLGMVCMYRDSKKDKTQLEFLLKSNTEAVTAMTEVGRTSNSLMVEVKDAMIRQEVAFGSSNE